MAYSDKVIDHYENPRNVGKLDEGDDNVGTGMVGAPACGEVMRLQIQVLRLLRKKLYGRTTLLKHGWYSGLPRAQEDNNI